MNNESPQKAVLMVLAVAFACSIMVSVAAIGLQPIQARNALVERSRNIVALTGLAEPGQALSDDDILSAVEQLDVRVLNIDTGEFAADIDPATFDARAAAGDPELSTAIDPDHDLARLGRRSRYAVVHLVWEGDALQRVIVPIHGQGMWSTLFGFLALESDLNTIAAATFYEQAETAGLGDQITGDDWLATWAGRQLFGGSGNVRFRIATGAARDADHEVDGLSGATVTADAVTQLVAFWFGEHGYGRFLERLQAQTPARAVADGGQTS